MVDMIRSGLAWLTGQLAAHAAQTVTYARGYDQVDVPATLGAKLLRLDDGMGGIRLEWTDMDFLIPAADLNFEGAMVTPERGDLVHVTVGYDVETYEVRPFGSEPCWRWSDPNHSMIRVHTKRVSTELYYA
jgi:hypothetical protein